MPPRGASWAAVRVAGAHHVTHWHPSSPHPDFAWKNWCRVLPLKPAPVFVSPSVLWRLYSSMPLHRDVGGFLGASVQLSRSVVSDFTTRQASLSSSVSWSLLQLWVLTYMQTSVSGGRNGGNLSYDFVRPQKMSSASQVG